MVEKVLHGINVGACCGQLATAAVDIASTGGIATAISGGLSVLALKGPSQQKELEAQCLAALHAHLSTAGLRDRIEKQIILMLDSYLPGKAQFAKGDMEAAKVANLMRTQIENETNVPEFKDADVLDAYEALLSATLAPLLAPKTRTDAFQKESLARQTEQTAMASEMLDILRGQGAYRQLQDAGISEEAILGQIRRVSQNTSDLKMGMNDLSDALDRLVAFEKAAQRGTNHASDVDRVLSHASTLVNQDRPAEARTLLSEARDRTAAEMGQLLSKEIDVAMIDNDADGAAALIVERADLEAGGQTALHDLGMLCEAYQHAGRDKGLSLYLRISLALAQVLVTRAGNADERGAALVALANTLEILGGRETGTERLDQAIEAHRAALLERTRDRVPLDWAMTQNNLGAALQTLGERDSDTGLLKDAITAFREALKEYTRDRVPLDWAMTQNNLGNALRTLGERDSDTGLLKDAATAYREALKERTRDRVPLGWAATQGNLCNVEVAFFDQTEEAAHLEAAQSYLDGAREVFEQAGASQYLRMADSIQADIDQRRAAG